MKQEYIKLLESSVCPDITIADAQKVVNEIKHSAKGLPLTGMVHKFGKTATQRYLVCVLGLELIANNVVSYNQGEKMNELILIHTTEPAGEEATLQSFYKTLVAKSAGFEDYMKLTFDATLGIVRLRQALRKVAQEAGYKTNNIKEILERV